MANGGRIGLFGGLAQGLAQGFESGARIGLLGQQLQEQRAERAAQEKDREMNRNLAKLNVAFQVIGNKNLPPATKLQAFNEGVVGPWNSIFSGPGSTVAENLLSPLPEWNDALSEYGKRAQKILADKTLSFPQKQEGLSALMVEAQSDFNLAPMVDALKTQAEAQLQADTLRAVEILTSDGTVTDDEAAEWATIRSRSPKAALEAVKIVDDRSAKEKEGKTLSERVAERRLATDPAFAQLPREQQLARIAEEALGIEEGLAELRGGAARKSKAKAELAELEPVLNIVGSVKAFANELITAESGPAALTQGVTLQAGALSRTNPVAAAYQDSKQAFLGVLARQLGGERGVLTDRDIKRIDSMLPGFTDTKAIRDIKLRALDNAVKSMTSAKQKVASGTVNIEQARAEVSKRIEELLGTVPKGKEEGEKLGQRLRFNPETGRIE